MHSMLTLNTVMQCVPTACCAWGSAVPPTCILPARACSSARACSAAASCCLSEATAVVWAPLTSVASRISLGGGGVSMKMDVVGWALCTDLSFSATA